ncbi:Asialoglycoprotein receptor 1 [Plakobranchus ocellatus]|uniref:Asialoglycoprotein receptor 1 n=1 Tax=Plakobranchus ocellatus TaxID=259542 RepID=A0AAV4A6K0_9GAST|nr:Asialoglycoprotein receptor 1 [Plakobranchus ocellatus]
MATFGQCCFLILLTIFFTTFFAKAYLLINLRRCWGGWLKTPSGANCVKLFDNPGKSWYDARRACKSFGGDLVTIRDKDKSNFIKEKFVYNNINQIWIGLYKPLRYQWGWLDENVKVSDFSD